MIVVADSSPLVELTNIDQLSILLRLLGTVTAPPEVISGVGQCQTLCDRPKFKATSLLNAQPAGPVLTLELAC